MILKTITLTPELAAEYLNGKAPNRPIRAAVVARYRKDIEDGAWRLTHQGIALDESGALIDGQHRCAAVVAAGKPIVTVVALGLPRTAQLDVDGQAKRSVADALCLVYGDQFNQKVVALANAMYRPAKSNRGTSVNRGVGTLSPEACKCFVDRHRDCIAFARSLFTSSKRGLPASVQAVVARAWYHVDRGRLALFAEILNSPAVSVGVEAPSAALLLGSFLSGGKLSKPSEIHFKTEGALRAFIEKRGLEKLYSAQEELFPLPEETVVAKRAEKER